MLPPFFVFASSYFICCFGTQPYHTKEQRRMDGPYSCSSSSSSSSSSPTITMCVCARDGLLQNDLFSGQSYDTICEYMDLCIYVMYDILNSLVRSTKKKKACFFRGAV